MRKRMIMGGVMLALSTVVGCSGPQLTQAQLNAIETREVEATVDQTYSAASGALFDAGYTIAMSDRAAGLLTGRKGKDKSSERAWLSPHIRDDEFVVSIMIREMGPGRSAVRVKTSKNGEAVVDKTAIDGIWVLMQRQVLMKEPSTGAITAPAGPAKPAAR